MKYLKKFNESIGSDNIVNTEFRNIMSIIRGNWKSKDDIGEIDEEAVKSIIDADAHIMRLGKPTIVFCLKYALEFGRLGLAKYIISKYKNDPIKSDDITDILKWIRNSDKMTNELKNSAVDLLERYIGYIY